MIWRLAEVVELVPETSRTASLLLDVPGWDGHAVLTFADQAALDLAFASPEWKAATAQTKGMGGRRIILITDEVDLLAGIPNG